jgi:hypothetical protein
VPMLKIRAPTEPARHPVPMLKIRAPTEPARRPVPMLNIRAPTEPARRPVPMLNIRAPTERDRRQVVVKVGQMICTWCKTAPAEVVKMQAKIDRQAAELKRLRAALRAKTGNP